MKYYKILFLICFFFLSNILLAQNEFNCLTIFEDPVRFNRDNSSSEWDYYRNQTLYVPDGNAEIAFHDAPVKTIDVNINIIQKDDGSGNFEDSQDTRQRFRTIISWINDFYSRFSPSDKIEWVDELPNYDSRIRFSIGEEGNERIFFYKNTNWWYYNDASCAYNIFNNFMSVFCPERLEAVNVFVFGNPNNVNFSNALPPSWSDFEENAAIAMFYWPSQDSDYARAGTLAHELGHILGLLHTYAGAAAEPVSDPNNLDFLKDVFLTSLSPVTSNCPHICNYYADADAVNGDGITNNLMGGNKDQEYISPLQAGQMHRALSLTSSRKYVHCEKSRIPLIITDEQLWDFDIKLYRDLIVESGAKLTLTNHLVMNPDCRIIVKQGGKLIVDGATIGIDLYEKEQWQGVQVWGNVSQHQFAIEGQYEQGYLELKNGAKIENAITAVDLWDGNNYNTAGGIVKATDSYFINNSRTVRCMPYRNFNPINSNIEYPYNAVFRNCSFEINDSFIGNSLFREHVYLKWVTGFKFYGCDFILSGNAGSVTDNTYGIYSSRSGLNVDAVCSSLLYPCDEYDRSLFSGFTYGISAEESDYPVTIKRTDFVNNKYGVSLYETSCPTILQSTFQIGGNGCGYGIFCEGSHRYIFEENSFSKHPTMFDNTYGILMRNTMSTNRVYRNTFEGLYCGNIAIGNNVVTDAFGEHISGLSYECNTNANNEIDFYVDRWDGVSYNGIQRSIGNEAVASGNVFSATGFHFYNNGDDCVDYYYANNIGETPYGNKCYRVYTHLASENTCLSNYDNNLSVVFTEEERLVRERDFLRYYNDYYAFKQLLNSRVDGGNTNAELSNVRNASMDNMWDVRTTLLGHSPYLSQEVLFEIVDKNDVFPESVIFEILASNLDELKKDTLISHLESQVFPLPDYMIEMLEQLAYGTTVKTVLQNQILRCKYEYTNAANDIIRSILNDTIIDYSELRGWLGNLGELDADVEIVSTYIRQGDYDSAFSLANMLPSLYNLQGEDLESYNGYMRLIGLFANLESQGRNVYLMNDAETKLVDSISLNGRGMSKAMAEGILNDVGDLSIVCDCPQLDLPETNMKRSSQTVFHPETLELFDVLITLTPNPAATWVEIDYMLPDPNKRAKLSFSNIIGVKVFECEFEGEQGKKVIDLRGWTDGLYIYTLQFEDYVQTGKLLISK